MANARGKKKKTKAIEREAKNSCWRKVGSHGERIFSLYREEGPSS